MFDYPYLIELLTPRRPQKNGIEGVLERFATKFRKIMASGCGVSIPDNPMGQPRLSALDCVEHTGLKIDPRKFVMTLNTFHTEDELNALLEKASAAKLRYILVVRGDGGPRLPRLDPRRIGGKHSVATSMDLIRFINTQFKTQFVTGAAFNPYKPMPHEYHRVEQKVEAGAEFIITQPIIGKNKHVSQLEKLGIPIVIEAWMSTNIDLFLKSVGIRSDDLLDRFDPVDNLKSLHKFYPSSCVYLSMLPFDEDWRRSLPRILKEPL